MKDMVSFMNPQHKAVINLIRKLKETLKIQEMLPQ